MHCDTFLQQVLFPMAHKLALITFKYTGKSMAWGITCPYGYRAMVKNLIAKYK